jgi:glycosyltransferase involved in cell wall biosynthesis
VPHQKTLLILTRLRAGAPFRQRIEPYLEPLTARGISWKVVEMSKWPLQRRAEMLEARHYGAVLLHRKTLTAWDATAMREARRLIYDVDDAVMHQARASEEPHGGRLRRFRRTVARADLVIAGAPVLAEEARQAGALDVRIVPTGLDTRLYPRKQTYAADGPVRLVWIGSSSTLKQLDLLQPVLQALGRAMPDLILRVIADGEFKVSGLKVENVRWSPEMEARLLAESNVGIAPLPDTPYTRGKCGFKVLQYMAAGLPVVASPVGVNADYVRPDATGYLARTADEWVTTVKKLAGDAELRARLGLAGRSRVVEEFDFSVLAPKVCDLIEETME